MTKEKHRHKKGLPDEIEEEKERLFRTTKHHVQEGDPFEKSKVFDKDVSVHLTFNLRQVILASLFIVIIAGVFMLGRYGFPVSASGSTIKNLSETSEQIEAAADSSDTTTNETNSTTDDNSNVTTTDDNDTDDSNNTTSSDNSSDDEEEEPVIYETLDEYQNVQIILNQAYEDWKGTWGKITSISVTIKNKETVGIKPNEIYLTVDGYPQDDYELIILPSEMRKVAPGHSITKKLDIPDGGFSYSENVVDPEEVEITIRLRDGPGTLMDSDMKEFDLSG